jgi:hypothetical protein
VRLEISGPRASLVGRELLLSEHFAGLLSATTAAVAACPADPDLGRPPPTEPLSGSAPPAAPAASAGAGSAPAPTAEPDEPWVHIDAPPTGAREDPTDGGSEPPPNVQALGRGLLPHSGLSAEERIARAYRLGVSDAVVVRRLEQGEFAYQEATPVPKLRTAWHVVLACPGVGAFWTDSSSTARAHTREPSVPGAPFRRGVVYRGLASKAEARIYLAGAGIQEISAR